MQRKDRFNLRGSRRLQVFANLLSFVLPVALPNVSAGQIPKIDLAPYDFGKFSCAKQTVEFLDDTHLLLSVLQSTYCQPKKNVQPPTPHITVIDLDGKNPRSVPAEGVVAVVPGPVGHITVATMSEVKVLSLENFAVVWSQPILLSGKYAPNLLLSPSRKLVSVEDDSTEVLRGKSRKARYRLFNAESSQAVEEHIGRFITGISDHGYAVCSGTSGCKSITIHDRPSLFGDPPDRNQPLYFFNESQAVWLGYDKQLHFMSSGGPIPLPMELKGIYPPFSDLAQISDLSATTPRRLLLYTDGCLLGDFDDCYGKIYYRVTAVDPQFRKVIFQRSIPADAAQRISPDGHHVALATRTHIYLLSIP